MRSERMGFRSCAVAEDSFRYGSKGSSMSLSMARFEMSPPMCWQVVAKEEKALAVLTSTFLVFHVQALVQGEQEEK